MPGCASHSDPVQGCRYCAAAPTQALATTEATRLAELEATVAAGLRTFVEVGEALREIRDQRLYRADHARTGLRGEVHRGCRVDGLPRENLEELCFGFKARRSVPTSGHS